MAASVLSSSEQAWREQVDNMGLRSPLPDGGLAGSDGNFDVYLWRGQNAGYVVPIGNDPSTLRDDRITIMVIDPWGAWGGPLLPSTIQHEFHHACQAAYSWSEHPSFYESSATFTETELAGSAALLGFVFEDFQDRPHWSLARYDRYRTWYTYGSALYWMFLRDRYFSGTVDFLAQIWQRSVGGTEGAGSDDEPDFVDATNALLSESRGVSYTESVIEFSRWRWYTGDRDDGLHIRDAALLAQPATKRTVRTTSGRKTRVALRPAPQIYGSTYIRLRGPASGPLGRTINLTVRGHQRARLVVQALPGPDGSDGEFLDFSSGPASLSLSPGATRTLVVTAVPLEGTPYDANARPRRQGARMVIY